ncbi:hypothetical protein CD798_12205 [Bacillaceae bacterium SAOS 7]|nr:hypothetical protein CD798_12205 [Bacillaceae bacterium SAOS 7]
MSKVKYLEVSRKIEDQFLDENRQVNRLPKEIELAKLFGVSRETIRKALNQLIARGKIYSIQGSGYYVRKDPISMVNPLNKLSSITEMIQNAGLVEGDMDTKIYIDQPSIMERELLKLEEHEQVYIIERIRTAKDQPVVFSKNLLPFKLVGESFKEYYHQGSLSRFLETIYGIEITEALAEVQALSSKELLPQVFSQMDVPVLKFVQSHYTIEGEPVLLSYDFMRNDTIKFFIQRQK